MPIPPSQPLPPVSPACVACNSPVPGSPDGGPIPERLSPEMVSQERLPIGARHPWLAPLAGYSDLPFRLLCREMGAAVACTEMVSAKGLVLGQGKKSNATNDLLATFPPLEPPVAYRAGPMPYPEPGESLGSVVPDRQGTYHCLRLSCAYLD